MQKIAVYCGSNFGESKAYFDAAQELGLLLAQEQKYVAEQADQ